MIYVYFKINEYAQSCKIEVTPFFISKEDVFNKDFENVDVVPQAGYVTVNGESDSFDCTVESAEQLVQLCEGFDVLAAVLPIHLHASLYKIKPPSLKVIFSKTERVALNKIGKNSDSGLEESCYKFVHSGWYEVESLKCQINKL